MPRDRAISARRPPEFRPLRHERRYEQVAEQIQKLVSSGKLKPGDKLPSERDLSQQLGVGRSSIRDAVRTLETMGILEARHGHGTVVRNQAADALVVPLKTGRRRELIGELLDVRRMLEPALAARAAKNASAAEIAHMQAILARHELKLRRGDPAIEEDSQFHYAIALAARNSVVLKVLDVLMDQLVESRSRSLQVQGRAERSYEGHRSILRAIQKRDAKAAEAAVRRHLEEIEEIVVRQL
ncbi:MAG TPA: FadR/GntR family transcriptional regulator [Myxococcales bacterium]|nr:FadR/GntR family transcriptional regulator [Myxococcales bacterium]